MEIQETVFKKDRFYVVVKTSDGRTNKIPRANFVWLRGNPSFKEIPKGYVVHHLDHDKTNDDISNIVIMAKFHHVAHHWKQKTVDSVVTVEEDRTRPIKRPKVYMDAKTKRFYVNLIFLNPEGKKEYKRVYRENGCGFMTKGDAEKYIDKIWGVL